MIWNYEFQKTIELLAKRKKNKEMVQPGRRNAKKFLKLIIINRMKRALV